MHNLDISYKYAFYYTLGKFPVKLLWLIVVQVMKESIKISLKKNLSSKSIIHT